MLVPNAFPMATCAALTPAGQLDCVQVCAHARCGACAHICIAYRYAHCVQVRAYALLYRSRSVAPADASRGCGVLVSAQVSRLTFPFGCERLLT